MKDTELEEIFGISKFTLAGWKKTPSTDWRSKLYTYLSLKSVEEIKPEMERVQKILEARADKKDA